MAGNRNRQKGQRNADRATEISLNRPRPKQLMGVRDCHCSFTWALEQRQSISEKENGQCNHQLIDRERERERSELN